MNNAAEVITPAPEAPRYLLLVEQFRDAVREAIPLIRAHGEEIGATHLPVPFRPALNLYADMERQGRLWWASVRAEDGRMVGYAMLLFAPFSLAAGRDCALLEAVYLIPTARCRAVLQDLLLLIEQEACHRQAVALVRSVWMKKGGRHPTQLTRWKFLE
ncbi:MAG: hypothetical protein KGL39_06980 [Patescibacteria group bacterium]|nr:hypothetical protein [Patescibacteria group bacterium]